MALYKGNKRYTTTLKLGEHNVQPLTITKDGTYIAPASVTGFSPITVSSNNGFNVFGNHTDANGIWHRPDDWDDIESIDLTDKHEVYFLCACHLTGTDFFRIRFYGSGTLSWSYGHVNNGTYTLHENSTETTVTTGDYISLYLSDIVDDYIVVRIKSTTGIASCSYQTWEADEHINYAAPFRCQSVLMRYGRMVEGNTLASSATYCLESDNIIDFAKNYQGTTTTITMASAYSSSFNLQRWRCTGWDLSKNKVTSFASLFENCYCLCDVPDPLDLTGWVRSYTTTTASMFSQCYSLNTHLITKNWNLTAITTMASTFNYCRSLKNIEGTETWSSAPKCTTVASLFNMCMNVKNALDVSNCYFGNGTANLTTVANMFSYCYNCPSINISNMNLSKCTTLTYMLSYTSSCKQIIMNNITAISSICTNTSYFCNYSAIPELIINGWNFSGNRGNFLTYGFQYAQGLKKLVFRNCTAPSGEGVTIADTSNGCMQCRYAYNLEYLDVSFMDMSVFSSTHTHTDSFRDLQNLIDFYPPQNISKSFNLTNNFKLSHDSLVRVINNLKTVSSTATLTIGAYNISKLSAAEQAVATNKGWTLA